MASQHSENPPVNGEVVESRIGQGDLRGRSASHSASTRVVETADGKLQGLVIDGIATFKGVRYADSTAGQNRFLPPQKLKPWADVRDATELGHPCVQNNEDFPIWLDPMPGSEDCLVLNVWSPETALPTSKLPVMVWIHGGGYKFGSAGAPMYDGRIVAGTGNVVCISLNHRLHAFGFTNLSADGDERFVGSGNAGLLDIVAALQWVCTNIEAFGGDPNNVTLFGQSGGGAKISTLLAMPVASGLFHRAIIQSGSVFRYRGLAEAEAMSSRMFSILKIAPNDISALQNVPADALLKCAAQIENEGSGTVHPALKYAPVVDGRVIPIEPWRTGSPKWAENVPIILGSTIDETIIYSSLEKVDDASVAEAVANSATVYIPDLARITELVPAYHRAFPQLSNPELVVRISTDIGFWKNAIHQAEMHSKTGGPVYMYRCDWKTPCFGGMWGPHGMELPFVIGHGRYGTAWDGKDSEAARSEADPDNSRFKLGDRMLAAWVNFARSGNPSLPDLPWPQYDLTTRSTMIFNAETTVEADPSGYFRTLVSTI